MDDDLDAIQIGGGVHRPWRWPRSGRAAIALVTCVVILGVVAVAMGVSARKESPLEKPEPLTVALANRCDRSRHLALRDPSPSGGLLWQGRVDARTVRTTPVALEALSDSTVLLVADAGDPAYPDTPLEFRGLPPTDQGVITVPLEGCN